MKNGRKEKGLNGKDQLFRLLRRLICVMDGLLSTSKRVGAWLLLTSLIFSDLTEEVVLVNEKRSTDS